MVYILLYIHIMKKKHFTTSIDKNLLKEIKKLAIDLDRSVNDLLEEGIKHLLTKYQKKAHKVNLPPVY